MDGVGQTGYLLAQFAAYHVPHQQVPRHLGDRRGRDATAVAQHGDTVCHDVNFFQPVRDVNDAYAAGAKACDHREQALGFALGKRCRRLVHHDQPRNTGQGARDLYKLLLADAQLSDQRARIHLVSEFSEYRVCPIAHVAPFHDRQSDVAGGMPAEKDVLGDAQLWDQGEFLMDETDAQVLRGSRMAHLDRRSGPLHSSSVGLQDAAHDIHERRFPGAVLPDERVHFTVQNIESDTAEHRNTAEAL